VSYSENATPTEATTNILFFFAKNTEAVAIYPFAMADTRYLEKTINISGKMHYL
jgi:hypothetical protein